MSEEQRATIISQLQLRSFEVSDFSELQSSVTTKGGDTGYTQLLFGQKVEKWHPRIRLVGRLDFLSSLLNLSKIHSSDKGRHLLNRLQEQLVYVMGEVATDSADIDRFLEGYHSLTDADILDIEAKTEQLENSGAKFTGWVENLEQNAAFAESARTVARETESMAWELHSQGLLRDVLPRWLNRLSDLLWAFARMHEQI